MPVTDTSTRKQVIKMVNEPSVNASDYLVEEDEYMAPKHGTTVQSGWDAAAAFLKPKKEAGAYPTNFKLTEKAQLIRFMDDAPFFVYQEHWINRTEGKRSFVCLGAECPLCTIAGDHPRPRFVFNVLVLTTKSQTSKLLPLPLLWLVLFRRSTKTHVLVLCLSTTGQSLVRALPPLPSTFWSV